MPPRRAAPTAAASARAKAAATKAEVASPTARATVTGGRATTARGAKAAAAKGGVKKKPSPRPAAKGGRGGKKIVKSSEVVDSEAEEGEEDEDDVELDDGDTIEELSAETLSDEEVVSVHSSEEELDVRPPVEKTPKLNRRAKETPVPSPVSPSPVKTKATSVRKTPAGKRGKRDESDEEVVFKVESPTKKTRVQETSDDEVQIVAVRGRTTQKAVTGRNNKAASGNEAEVSKTPRVKLPLPRRPTVKAQLEAKAMAAAKKKVVKAPDSAEQVFNPDMDDVEEDLYKKQTALFRKTLTSADDFDEMNQVLDDIKGGQDHSSPHKLTATKGYANRAVKFEEDEAMEVDGDLSDGAGHNGQSSPSSWPSTPVKQGKAVKSPSPAKSSIPVSNDPPRVPIVDLSDVNATDPVLKKTYLKLPLLKPHAPDYGSYAIQTMLLGEGMLNQVYYNLDHKKMMDLVLYAYDPKKDSPLVVNPARISPELLMAGLYKGSNHKVASFQTPSGPQRAICFSVGTIFGCNIYNPTSFAKSDRNVKQVLLGPIRGENERALAYLGNVFDSPCLGINTFGVTVASGERIQGLSIRTFPTSAGGGNGARVLPGMGFTPNKAGSASGSSDSRPSRSLLDMRDKTTWSANDDIAIWDARDLFEADSSPKNIFKHDQVTSLKRVQHDLRFGDIAIVYYSASTYPLPDSNGFFDATLALSLNLYGVVLVASAPY